MGFTTGRPTVFHWQAEVPQRADLEKPPRMPERGRGRCHGWLTAATSSGTWMVDRYGHTLIQALV
jgi:hypothetical protein